MINASSEGSAVAQWEQAGLATLREVVRVELGAKLFVGGNVSLGAI